MDNNKSIFIIFIGKKNEFYKCWTYKLKNMTLMLTQTELQNIIDNIKQTFELSKTYLGNMLNDYIEKKIYYS